MSETAKEILYKISDVEKIIGVSRKALQEYDKMDMIHPTTKTEGGYWLYDEDALMTINVIQMFSMVGYSRKEIKEFLPTVTGFEHFEERKERFEEAIKRLEEKKAQIETLISMAKIMKDGCGLPKEVLKQMHDYKKGGTFGGSSNKERMEQLVDNLSKQDDSLQELINETVTIMMPYTGKLMLLACYQEEDPYSTVVQEKVMETFEEWKSAYPAFVRAMEAIEKMESIENKSLFQQMEIFCEYSKAGLGGLEPSMLGDSLEMQLNHRYGEGTGDRIREMLDAFVAIKREELQKNV